MPLAPPAGAQITAEKVALRTRGLTVRDGVEISGAKAARTAKMATVLAELRGVVSSSVSGSVWASPLQG